MQYVFVFVYWASSCSGGSGDVLPAPLFASDPSSKSRWLRGFLADTEAEALAFAGCKMIRRIVGVAHVADFEEIADPGRRAACERNALRLAREMVLAGVAGRVRWTVEAVATRAAEILASG